MQHLLSPSLSTHLSHVRVIFEPGRKLARNADAYGWQIPSKNKLCRFGFKPPPIGQNSVAYSVVTLKPFSIGRISSPVSSSNGSNMTLSPPIALNMDPRASFGSVTPRFLYTSPRLRPSMVDTLFGRLMPPIWTIEAIKLWKNLR